MNGTAGGSAFEIVNLHLPVAVLLFVRIFATFSGCLLFNKSRMPGLLRAGLSLLLALLLDSSGYFGLNNIDFNSFYYIMLTIKEAVVGYLMGVLLSVPFWLVESCGKIVDQQRGEQFAAMLNPLTANTSSSVGRLLFQAFIGYFVAVNGILAYLSIIFKSFLLIKIGEFFPASPLSGYQIYVQMFSAYCYSFILLTLPILILTILTDLVLGLIGSFIPQLNITVISIPVKSVMVTAILIFMISDIYHDVFAKVFKLSQKF